MCPALRSHLHLLVLLVVAALAAANDGTAVATDALVRTPSQSWFVDASNEHCDSCTTKLDTILSALDNNATMTQLLHAMEVLCLALPVNFQECKELATNVVTQIERLDKKLLEEYSPRQLCTIFSFCTAECCGTPYWPQEIHISLTGNPTEMFIMWVTLTETPGPVALIGSSPDSLSRTVNATARTYTQGGWLGTIYVAFVDNLQPSTRYYYTVGDPEWHLSRNTYSFVTAPALPQAGARATTTKAKFAVYGDMGATDVSDNTILRLLNAASKGEVDVVLHAGDISYADGYQPLWDQYLMKIEPLAARIPYMTAAGNHEEFFDFTAYRNRFQMPVENLHDVTRANMSLYYSFNYGPVHVVAFSCEAFWGLAPNLKPGNAQYNWLVQDLEQANKNRDAQPWIVMYAHRPLYCTYNSKKRCEVQAQYYRDMIEDVVFQNGVDIVIGAHLHNYERTYPVYQESAVQTNYSSPSAPVYAVVGTGGNKEGTQGNFQTPAPSWSVESSRLAEWGYVLMEADGASSLQWQFISSTTGEVMDEFTITK